MKTLNTIYQGAEALVDFCQENGIKATNKLLLQVFVGIPEYDYISDLISTVTEILPNINIIGSTTSGEIIGADDHSNSTVLSFSIFEKSHIQVHSANKQNSEFETGLHLLKQAKNIKKAKVAIVFKSGLDSNGELFLNAFNQTTPNLVVAGGLAGDNANFKENYVFTNKHIYNSGGVVAAFLSGEELTVNTSSNFGWDQIGKSVTISKSSENVVHSIDNMSAMAFYTKYLGSQVAQKMPIAGVEFPIIVDRGGIPTGRAVTANNEDGSLVFAGNVIEGEQVHLGYGNVDKILNNSFTMFHQLQEKPIESIFVYYCMARKHFLKEDVMMEVAPLEQIAPVSGFFTYGEFYHDCDDNTSNLLNQAMTILTLSENNHTPAKLRPNKEENFSLHIQTIKIFTHLIQVTTEELEESKKKIQQQLDLINENIIISILDLKGQRTYVSKAFCDITGFEKEDVLNVNHKMNKEPDFNRRLFGEETPKLSPNKTWKGEIKNYKKNGEPFWTQTSITPNLNERGEIISYTCISQDITDKKIIEKLSITDELTNTFNRRHFNELFANAVTKAQKDNQKLCFMFIDVDHFKQYNDKYGHQCGDVALVKVADCLIQQLKTVNGDCFRMGGEEFATFFEVQNSKNAINFAHQLKEAVVKLGIEHKKNTINPYVSVSIGMICQFVNKTNADEIYREADGLLYKAKNQGRNQVAFKVSD